MLIGQVGNPNQTLARPLPVTSPDTIQDSFEAAEAKTEGLYTKINFQQDQSFYPGLRELTVMPGDTLQGMLMRQGFKIREITERGLINVTAQLNGIETKSVLRIGTKLVIPSREFVTSQGAA